MPNTGLNAELAKAAANLEERLRLLRAPSRKIPKAKWNALSPEMKAAIPTWIPLLLSQYALASVILEYPDKVEAYRRSFQFAHPEDYKFLCEEDGLYWQLWQAGFVPFARDEHGNVWVIDGNGTATGQVFYYDYSSQDPSRSPAEGNGLIFASSRLEFLFASM